MPLRDQNDVGLAPTAGVVVVALARNKVDDEGAFAAVVAVDRAGAPLLRAAPSEARHHAKLSSTPTSASLAVTERK